MLTKHTYFLIVCFVILLVSLSFGTLIFKEGYDDYIVKLLESRGYRVNTGTNPDSQGISIQSSIRCPDGTIRYDHVDADCEKEIRPFSNSLPGQPESCTLTKMASGEIIDSCKEISNTLFCDSKNKRCNTLLNRELQPGQICKYPNECLSRDCNNNVCGGIISKEGKNYMTNYFNSFLNAALPSIKDTSNAPIVNVPTSAQIHPGSTQPTGSAQGSVNNNLNFSSQFGSLLRQDVRDIIQSELQDSSVQTTYLGSNESCC